MSEAKMKKGQRTEGETIYRDTYYIRPISFHGTATKSDQYGCSICDDYEIGTLQFLIKHQQKCEGKK